MVAPDCNLLNFLNLSASPLSKLADSSALVKSGKSAEVLLRDRRSIVRCDEGVGVGGVSNNSDLHGLLGNLIDSLTLSLENLGISSKEISTLHARASGASADKHGNISILESNKRVSSSDDRVNVGVSAIVEFHDETLEDLLGSWELNELQDDLLVRSEHSALSNEVAKEVADLTSGAGDCDSDGGLLEVPGGGGEVSAELLQPAHENVVLHTDGVLYQRA